MDPNARSDIALCSTLSLSHTSTMGGGGDSGAVGHSNPGMCSHMFWTLARVPISCGHCLVLPYVVDSGISADTLALTARPLRFILQPFAAPRASHNFDVTTNLLIALSRARRARAASPYSTSTSSNDIMHVHV